MIISFCARAEPNLSAGMHDLNSGYASLSNRRYRRSGSPFQGRFKAILVENQSHAWELSRYLHLNPVRAKMVPLPEQYRWSSYSAYRFARDAADERSGVSLVLITAVGVCFWCGSFFFPSIRFGIRISSQR
jgi:hypothetical protein